MAKSGARLPPINVVPDFAIGPRYAPLVSIRATNLQAPRSTLRVSPHLFGNLHDQSELRPLLVLGQGVSFLGRREAALRRKTELIEGNEPGRFVDAALELIARFELSAFRGDEAEHHHLVLRHQPQRLEAARALAVVFHEIGVDLDLVEQNFSHRLIAPGGNEGGTEIAAT